MIVNNQISSITGPENALDKFVTYQYRYWLCLRNVNVSGDDLYNTLDTTYYTKTRFPYPVDDNTMLLYHSVTDSHLYIENLEYTTMYTGIEGCPMQPTNEMVMSIKEPYGCFFIEKIERAMKQLSVSSWGGAYFYTKIDFVGTLPDGSTDVQPGVWFHWVPGSNIGVSVNNMAGSDYTFAGTITDYCPSSKFDEERTVFPHKDAITIRGDTVQTMLNDLQDKLNRSYEEAAKALGGNVKKVRYVFDAGVFGTYDMSVNSADHVRNAGQGETEKDGGDAKNSGQTLVCKPDTSIASFINDKILMNSKQYIAKLSSNREKVAKMDQSGLTVAKIIYSPKLTDSELVFEYKIVEVEGKNFGTLVEEQKASSTVVTTDDVKIAKENAPGKFTPDDCYVFNFHYTFGTENTNVETFEMRAENIVGFINADNIGTTDNTLNMSSKSKERFKSNVFNENDNQFETARTKPSYAPGLATNDVATQPQTRNLANSGAHNNDSDTAATKKDAQSSLFRFSSCPGLALSASIRGHMALLRIDKYLKDKEVETQKATGILAKFEVRNIDGEAFWNNGYYLIQSIGNKFQGGKFKQTLTGFYLGDQTRDEAEDPDAHVEAKA